MWGMAGIGRGALWGGALVNEGHFEKVTFEPQCERRGKMSCQYPEEEHPRRNSEHRR